MSRYVYMGRYVHTEDGKTITVMQPSETGQQHIYLSWAETRIGGGKCLEISYNERVTLSEFQRRSLIEKLSVGLQQK